MVGCITAYTLDFVLGALPPGARRVVEVGCGDGEIAAALQEHGFDVAAIDADEACVAAARRQGVAADCAVWPDYPATRVDAILFTRSLHHVEDLDAALDAAVTALADGGRVIVEDFMAEGCTSRSDGWFSSICRLLRDADLLKGRTPFLSQILGETVPCDTEHHDLHASFAIENALHTRFATVEVSGAAYYARYWLAALDEARAAALLSHEQELIELGAIDPFGRRFVAYNSRLSVM